MQCDGNTAVQCSVCVRTDESFDYTYTQAGSLTAVRDGSTSSSHCAGESRVSVSNKHCSALCASKCTHSPFIAIYYDCVKRLLE